QELAAIRLELDRDGSVSGPIATAIRESAHCVCNNFVNDPPRTGRDLPHGTDFRSGGAFPVRRSGNVVAALAVYSADAEIFDTEMIALLDEMAANLSVALDSIEHD